MNSVLSNRGNGLESLVISSQSPSTVLLTKVPTASKRIRTPRGQTIIQCKSACDFFGIYVPTRQLIVFDAKQSNNPNRMPTGDNVFPEHQRLDLIRYGEAGAIAGILAERAEYSELFWLPWQLLRTRQPSITWGAMVPLGSSKFAIKWHYTEIEGYVAFAGKGAVTP